MTEQHDRWKTLEIRQPDQVPAATPLSWLAEKESDHAQRLFRNLLPVDRFPNAERGTADDALAVLALRESIRRDVEHGTGNRIHEAMTLGATWTQVAAALDIEAGQARELLRAYADGQRRLWVGYEQEGIKPFGFSADQHAAVLALCELGDDEDYSDAATADAVMPRDPVELEERIAADNEEQHDATEPVKESTLRYAEELRSKPGTASADGHAGWECGAGASLIVEASTPGPGKLGTHHGVIYACAGHQAAAVERITASGYEVDPRPAPPGHRWNPWPCGHVTAHDAAALAALAQQEREEIGREILRGDPDERYGLPVSADSEGWDPDDPYGDVAEYERKYD